MKFQLGQIVATPGALEALADSGQDAAFFLDKHSSGDYGEVDAEDAAENELSLKEGFRILSAYRTLKGIELWVITKADRSSTTVFLPEEY